MPELPEVETIRRGIEPLIKDKQILGVTIRNGSLRWPVPEDLNEILAGQVVLGVSRRSKYLLVAFSHGTLIIHLGMTGHLRLIQQEAERRKHDHVELLFTEGSVLVFNDPRRFGSILWTANDPLQHQRLLSLGPEPFAKEFSATYLYAVSRRRTSIALKPFLMDAKVVVGVGNIYASEALFRAGVDPRKPACQVSQAAYAKIVAAVRSVLAESIAAGGTTIRDFADTDGNPGYFFQALQVYGRSDQPCVTCHEPIRQLRLGQRATYFCPHCQR